MLAWTAETLVATMGLLAVSAALGCGATTTELAAEDPTDGEESGDTHGGPDSGDGTPLPRRARLVYGEYSPDVTASDASVTVRAVDVVDAAITSIDLRTASAVGHGPYQLLHISMTGDALVVESTGLGADDDAPGTWVLALHDEPFAATELARIAGHNAITYGGQLPLQVERIDDVLVMHSNSQTTATSISTGDVTSLGEGIGRLAAMPDAGAALLATEHELLLAQIGSEIEVEPLGSGSVSSVSAVADRVAFSISNGQRSALYVTEPGRPRAAVLVAEADDLLLARLSWDGTGLLVDSAAEFLGGGGPTTYRDLSTGETVELQMNGHDGTFTADGRYLIYETTDDTTAVVDRDSMLEVVYETRDYGVCAGGFFTRGGSQPGTRVAWQPLAGGDPIELATTPGFDRVVCAPSHERAVIISDQGLSTVEFGADGPGVPAPLAEFHVMPDDILWSSDSQFLVTRACDDSDASLLANGACSGTIALLSTATGEWLSVASGVVTAPLIAPTP